MFLYLPIKHEIPSSYIGPYHTFGLQVLRRKDEEDIEVLILPDVSTDYAFTLHLARLFTKEQLDPLHLPDVLEDLL